MSNRAITPRTLKIIRDARAMKPATTYAEISRLLGLDRSTVFRAHRVDMIARGEWQG